MFDFCMKLRYNYYRRKGKRDRRRRGRVNTAASWKLEAGSWKLEHTSWIKLEAGSWGQAGFKLGLELELRKAGTRQKLKKLGIDS